MRVVHLPAFATVGSGELGPRPGKLVAIAPSSEVDLCLVGGVRLAPGAVVPWHPSVAAVRGFRTDASPIGTSLSLIVAEECDAGWAAPPGRSPAVYTAEVVTMGVAGATSATRALRVPFSGRSSVVAMFRRDAGETDDATLIVRGVRYPNRARIAADSTFLPFFSELSTTVSLYGGTGAIPTSVLGGATVETGAVLVLGTPEAPLYQGWDELEFWFYGTAVARGLSLQVEVKGEEALSA